MNPRNLAHMAACIRNIAHNAPDGEQRACVEAGIRSLEYMHDGAADVLKAIVRLKKESPEIFRAFVDLFEMGAELVDVRPISIAPVECFDCGPDDATCDTCGRGIS